MLAVMEDPHQLREAGCTHTFCKACLEQALGAEGAARCPVCRAGAGADRTLHATVRLLGLQAHRCYSLASSAGHR